jgi:hypothetical protein
MLAINLSSPVGFIRFALRRSANVTDRLSASPINRRSEATKTILIPRTLRKRLTAKTVIGIIVKYRQRVEMIIDSKGNFRGYETDRDYKEQAKREPGHSLKSAYVSWTSRHKPPY